MDRQNSPPGVEKQQLEGLEPLAFYSDPTSCIRQCYRATGVLTLLACSICLWAVVGSAEQMSKETPSNGHSLAEPIVDGKWIRPATEGPAQPIWGHAEGLQIGLHPLRGPRGLLRVYAPYIGHPPGRVINFIAVEPIPAGQTGRGLSELEPSRLDESRGKRFWSANDFEDPAPRPPHYPARGRVFQQDGVEKLRVFVLVEPFENGAHVYLRLTFREDRPWEVGIATFAHDDSEPLDYCIVTATMGNYARLRQLHLDDQIVSARDLWPEYNGHGFTPHAKFDLGDMMRTREGHAIVTATPNEPHPDQAAYAPRTRRHWRYVGDVAKQYWRSENPDPTLQTWVNGRAVYWASETPIPGGISFENFEMVSPFEQGQEFWFGVKPKAKEPSHE